MRTRWANDHDIAHLQAKKTDESIWSKSAQWLLSYSICKAQRALIAPMGMLMWPWWANGHDIAHLQGTAVKMNLIWSECTWWLLSSDIHEIPRALIGPMWPRWANDHDAAHTQAKWTQWTWFGVSLSMQWLLSYRVRKVPRALITPVGMLIRPWWANEHDAAYLHAKTVPMNSFEWIIIIIIIC